VSPDRPPSPSEQPLRLYGDLADWYPLLTPPGDYVEEAASYLRLFTRHCERPPRTLLDLGSGGGHMVFHLRATLACTLVDRAPAMLAQSRRLNPDCEHVAGDLRSIRLGRTFDCVLLHDAVNYMTTRADLARAIATASAHVAPGGVALFQPDFVAETFVPGTETGGSDEGDRGLRYLEWRHQRAGDHESYVTDTAYLMRDAGGATVAHDRHLMGLFPRAVWQQQIAAAGFEARTVPFVHGPCSDVGRDVFLGLRPTRTAQA